MNFFTIEDTFSTEYEIKKSIFIASLVHIKKFKTLHEELKQKHPKANHIVWAKRELNEFMQVVENSSDDGEPKGTSGPPSLNVLRGSDIINAGVLIVRYFGGIKLGTGGLVRAYSSATKEVIKVSKLIKYEKKEIFKFTTDYSSINRYEHYLNKKDIQIHQRDFETNQVIWTLYLSEIQAKELEIFKNSLH